MSLRRSHRHRIVAGVCGGLAEWLGWSPTVVRILYVVLAVFPLVPGLLVYAVLWIVLPQGEQEGFPTVDGSRGRA